MSHKIKPSTAPRRCSAAAAFGLGPANFDPVGGPEPAGQGLVGLESRPAHARSARPWFCAVSRWLHDHASGRHRVDGKTERLEPGLVPRGGRPTNSQQMVPRSGNRQIAHRSSRLDRDGSRFPSRVASMSRADETGTPRRTAPDRRRPARSRSRRRCRERSFARLDARRRPLAPTERAARLLRLRHRVSRVKSARRRMTSLAGRVGSNGPS